MNKTFNFIEILMVEEWNLFFVVLTFLVVGVYGYILSPIWLVLFSRCSEM
ncbi:MAG: hypothetical protein HRU19_32170 [Pseudobacteriovorax sp.]|nr:hypothetical protein [Pseudobacteriovorax sp.]